MNDSHDRDDGDRPEPLQAQSFQNVDGVIVDPFSPEGIGEDPVAFAERVAFRLWSDGDVAGRAIEQARKDAGGVGRIDQVLVRQGLVDPEAAARAVATELNAPLIDLQDPPRTPVLPESLPMKFVAEASALPLADDGEFLQLALSDPLDDFTLRAIAMKTRRKLEIYVASAESIREAIAQIYRGAPSTDRRETSQRRLFDSAPAPASAARSQPFPEDAEPEAPLERSPRVESDARLSRPRYDDAAYAEPELDEAAFEAAPATRARFDDQPPAPPLSERPFFAPSPRARVSSPPLREDHDQDRRRDIATPRHHDDQPEEDKPRRAPNWLTSEAIAQAQEAVSRSKLDALRGMPSRRAETKPDGPSTPIDEPAPNRIAAPSEPPRRRGVLTPNAGADEKRPAAASGDIRRPKFVRPKRVTLKDWHDQGGRGGVDRMSREPEEMSIDPLAIPPMEGEASLHPLGATPQTEPQGRRRFMRGFVGGFTGGALPDQEDAPLGSGKPLSRSLSRRKARDEAARKLVATEIRAALRGETGGDGAPTPDSVGTTGRTPVNSPRSAIAALAEGEAAQINATAYQAAAALAQRERRRERARSAEEARRERGAPVRHQLTTKKVETPQKPVAKSSSVVADLEALGYRDSARETLEAAVTGGEGLILICGPSGAGKTSTMTALAKRTAGKDRKIERFDRSVEQRESDAPDRELVLMGAISGAESADAAARAAMRGALVIATLDVESVASATPRLIAMGLPPFALASCLRAVAAQHLAPRACSRCAGSGRSARDGGDCPQCGGSGFDGQINIVEVMAMDDAVRALILAQAPEEAFRHAMTAAGAPTLADDAASKIAAGLTNEEGAAAASAAARV
ncbi:MAG: Flp pilus assembly complex ATPase component TadA [Neomegalonema sp.]|nr:Flp pilus assembly complex ATPase component TadA [Neomegalonema sp.]